MAEDRQAHDVIVVGGGASGAAAAALLAGQEHDVLLLEAHQLPLTHTRPDWLSVYVEPILAEIGVVPQDVLTEPITRCTIYDQDFARAISAQPPQTPVHVVDYSRLVQAMLEVLARSDTGRVESGVEVDAVVSGEDAVTVTTVDQACYRGRILLIATGSRSELADRVGLPIGTNGPGGVWSAVACCRGQRVQTSGQIDLVLGVGGPAGFAYRLVGEGTIVVAVCGQSSPSAARGQLVQVAAGLHKQGLLGTDWEGPAHAAAPQWIPAGAALEVERHVGKRTLTIGQAGGFVAAYTNEGIYPAMWSAKLAAEVVDQALRGRHPQDKLREFDRLWRMNMADHLRAPHTDAKSILPLVFSNQQMAEKMLASFLLGENF